MKKKMYKKLENPKLKKGGDLTGGSAETQSLSGSSGIDDKDAGSTPFKSSGPVGSYRLKMFQAG